MKSSRTYSKKSIIRTGAIMLGLLVGFVSLNASEAYVLDSGSSTEEVANDHNSGDQSKSESIVSSFNAITGSSLQFSFNQESVLIETLPESEDRDELKANAQGVILFFDKVSKILFQSIISPNAP